MRERSANKKGKSLRITLVVVLVLLVAGGLLIGIDYHTYKDGGRSHFFGTLTTYNQNQTLHLDNLDLKVTGVKVSSYSTAQLNAKYQNCIAKDEQGNTTAFAQSLAVGLCSDSYEPETSSPAEFAQKYKHVEVDFSYSNISDQPIKFDTNNYDLLANTTKQNYFRECNYQWAGTLIMGSPQTSCVREDILKSYTGPLDLEVKLDGKTKSVMLHL